MAGAGIEDTEDALPRTSAINLGSVFSSSRTSWRTRRVSDDGTRPILEVPEQESASNTIKASQVRVAAEEDRQDLFGPFTSAVRQIQDPYCVLSTSTNVTFPPPPLILQLAQREVELGRQGQSSSSGSSLTNSMSSAAPAVPTSPSGPPNLRLTGVEKTGLGSVLGWEGCEARGRGMAGVGGFIRHQGLTVLYAEHVASGEPERTVKWCSRPRLVTFRYWSRTRTVDADRDRTLGEMVEVMCGVTAEEPCEREGCDKLRGRHIMSWTCAGVRVGGDVKADVGDAGDGTDVSMWQTCAVCGKNTHRTTMTHGT